METRQVLSEQMHVVPILNPRNLNSGQTCDIFSMKYYGHADILVMGAEATAGATVQVTVEQCTAAAGTGNTAIAFAYRKKTAGDSDVWGAWTDVAADEHAVLPASVKSAILIKLDNQQLSDGYPWVKLTLSDPATARVVGAYAFLSCPRYGQNVMKTALA